MSRTSKATPDDANEIQSLHRLVQQKPKNARLKSKLACALAEQQKLQGGSSAALVIDGDDFGLQEHEKEPLYWAQKAIEVAPEKPFGYAAMSVVNNDHDVKMSYLRKAVDLISNDNVSSSADQQVLLIVLLHRMLVEPREEEARRVRGSIGKASKLHPSKRILDPTEQETYDRLASVLRTFWQDKKTHTKGTVESVALREYKLGTFFRKLEPSRSQTHLERAMTHLSSDPASRHYHEWSMAQFWLATLGTTTTEGEAGARTNQQQQLDRCPKDYIVGLYSTFAHNFDALLVEKLHYQTPTLLRALLDQHCKRIQTKAMRFSRVLDLGCGTGLSGLAFRDCSERLEGVDLSPEMIAKARERGCYDRLMVGDVVDILDTDDDDDDDDNKDEPMPASLVIACDVFCYIGELKPILERVFYGMGAGAMFAFSTELLTSSSPGAGYKLHTCARFAHSRGYIEELSRATNFEIIAMEPSVIRKNQGEDVQGLLTILSKPQDPS